MSSAPNPVAELTDGQWHRLHPATPLLKGGIVLVVVFGIIINNLREFVVEMFLPGGRRGGEDDRDPVGYVVDNGYLWLVLLGVLVVVGVLIGLFYLSWRMSSFRVTDEGVEMRTGVVFRTNRRARLDRVQGINVQRPLLARVFGAAKLEINQAGHDANVNLAYLRSASADDLRREILRRAGGLQRAEAQSPGGAGPVAGVAPVAGAAAADGLGVGVAAGAGSDAPDGAGAVAGVGGAGGGGVAEGDRRARLGAFVEQRASEFVTEFDWNDDTTPARSVVQINPGRLIGSVLLSGYTLFLIAAAVAIVVSVATTGEYFLLFALLPAVLGSGGFYVNRISKSLRYTIASTRDGVRIGFGLLSTTNETLPPGRIHSVQVTQPLLWRPFGWWEVKINRASHSSTRGASNQENTTILPVGDDEDVRRVLELVLPELVGEAAADIDAEQALRPSEGVVSSAGTSADSVPTDPAPTDAVPADPAPTDAVPADPVPTDDAAELGRRLRQVADEHASRTLSLVDGGLRSRGAEGGFTTSPKRAVVLRWFSWRRNGFRQAPGAVLLRKGAIWRQLVIVPLPRIQSVGLRQGPLLRRLRLASVQLHTVQGPITADIGALDVTDAHDFFVAVSRDAVEAARADRTHRWLTAAGTTGTVPPAPAPAPAPAQPTQPAPPAPGPTTTPAVLDHAAPDHAAPDERPHA
ncbi:PH domain-containing protein [Frigoribacterium sp. 2-23]|uniref:PH domain-containing protein n=1 Tax=Frigoribacterium sp. 2-23 TaxID=3415006 RepID=UPI003C6F96D7